MRASDGYNESLSSNVRLENFVPASRPLRPIRQGMNERLPTVDRGCGVELLGSARTGTG